MKPGVLTPDMTQFNGQELRALVAYLQTLKSGAGVLRAVDNAHRALST